MQGEEALARTALFLLVLAQTGYDILHFCAQESRERGTKESHSPRGRVPGFQGSAPGDIPALGERGGNTRTPAGFIL